MTARKTRKPAASPPPKSRKPTRTTAREPAPRAIPRGFATVAWERVYLMAVELEALAKDAGLPAGGAQAGGFDLGDAARELARLAANYNRDGNPGGPTPEQEKEDWVAVGGVGADLGNMAEEGAVGGTADAARAVAYELCYLACNYLF